MGAGSAVWIADRGNRAERARVVDGRLLVSSLGGGGGGGDVNIAQYGGVAVGAGNPVDVAGTVAVSAVAGTVVVTPDAAACFEVDNCPGTTISIDDGGNVITVDGTVAVSSVAGTVAVSGTVAVGPTVTPGIANTDLGKADNVFHNSGSTGVMGLAVRNDGSVDLSGGDGNYGPLSLNATAAVYVDVQEGDLDTVGTVSTVTEVTTVQLVSDITEVHPGTGPTNLGKAEDSGHSNGDVGVLALGVRRDTDTPVSSDGRYSPFLTDASGFVKVTLSSTNVSADIASVIPGTGSTNLGKAEDQAHVSGDVGVMALGVRRDTPTALAADNDYMPPTFDEDGGLWVRMLGMDKVEALVLSGSTRGRPVLITATASTGTTLHTATTTAGEVDRIFIWLANTDDEAQTVTLEFGATGASSEVEILVPPHEKVLAVDGELLGGAATDTITAYASTGSVVKATGRVERLS